MTRTVSATDIVMKYLTSGDGYIRYYSTQNHEKNHIQGFSVRSITKTQLDDLIPFL